MTFSAQEIVSKVACGIRCAFIMHNDFKGSNDSEIANDEIRPEYLLTVKIAEQLTAYDHRVRLEFPLKKIKRQIKEHILQNNMSNWDKFQAMVKQINEIKFGKKDSQLMDIFVETHNDPQSIADYAPHILLEAKLGLKNYAIQKDINRILSLFDMYREAILLNSKIKVYGVIAFHFFIDNGSETDLSAKYNKFIAEYKLYFNELQMEGLQWNAGVVQDYIKIEQPLSSSPDCNDDSQEHEIDRNGYAFIPCVIIIGNDPDIQDLELEM